MMKRRFSPFLSVIALSAQAQEDNFDDNIADGWTQFDSIKLASDIPTMAFELDDGTIRLSSTSPSPAPSVLGPVRGSAIREEVVYQNSFDLSVDIPAYDRTLVQGFGLISMIQPNPGPGQTGAYAFTFNPRNQDVQISRIVNEVPENEPFLSLEDLTFTSGDELRMVFFGQNGVMAGLLYNLDDLNTPIGVCQATDLTYTSGTAGIVVSNFDPDRSGQTDATFDNYLGSETGIPKLTLQTSAIGEFQLSYPDWPFQKNLVLESSTTLAQDEWTVISPQLLTIREQRVSYYSDYILNRQRYFRLRPVN